MPVIGVLFLSDRNALRASGSFFIIVWRYFFMQIGWETLFRVNFRHERM